MVSGNGGTGYSQEELQQRQGLTGGAFNAADAVCVVQVVPMQLPIQAEFGELSGLSYSFQF